MKTEIEFNALSFPMRDGSGTTFHAARLPKPKGRVGWFVWRETRGHAQVKWEAPTKSMALAKFHNDIDFHRSIQLNSQAS